jgi:hypothetical protein
MSRRFLRRNRSKIHIRKSEDRRRRFAGERLADARARRRKSGTRNEARERQRARQQQVFEGQIAFRLFVVAA